MTRDYVQECLTLYGDARKDPVLRFHRQYLSTMLAAAGSSGNHQCWPGGYYSHVAECFQIALRMSQSLRLTKDFGLASVLYVLYFHDVEKMWKYGLNDWSFDKELFFDSKLSELWGFVFTPDEVNALKYIHGELDDYRKDKRVMNPLAGFCHAADVLSARTWPEEGKQWLI